MLTGAEATFFRKVFPGRVLQWGAGGGGVLSRSRWQGLGRHRVGKCTGEGGVEKIAQEDLGRERFLLLALGREVGSMGAS